MSLFMIGFGLFAKRLPGEAAFLIIMIRVMVLDSQFLSRKRSNRQVFVKTL
jgi:hypothetical protein